MLQNQSGPRRFPGLTLDFKLKFESELRSRVCPCEYCQGFVHSVMVWTFTFWLKDEMFFSMGVGSHFGSGVLVFPLKHGSVLSLNIKKWFGFDLWKRWWNPALEMGLASE